MAGYLTGLLFILLLSASHALGQIGEAERLGAVFPGMVTVGSGNEIGRSELPVCTPVSYACNTPQSLQYIFTGSGNWNVPSNWLNELVPPAFLPEPFEIYINPIGAGECILNVLQTITEGSKLTILPGKVLIVGEGKPIQ